MLETSKDFGQDFDHMTPAFSHNMATVTAALRQSCPIAHSDKYGGFWILSCYNDVLEVLRDAKMFSSQKGTAIPEQEREIPSLPVESDPPDHTHYRSLLNSWLAARRITTYEDSIRQFVTEHINDFIEQGTCDLVESLATRLPISITPIIMGIEAKDWPIYIQYIKQIMLTEEESHTEENSKIRQSFLHYMLKEIERRRIKPRNDFLTTLVTAQSEGKILSGKEIVSMMLAMLAAGLEPTKNALGNLLLTLCEYPSLRQFLLADPAAIPLFVEECLRYNAPLQYVARTPHQCTAIHGQAIDADEKLFLLLGSANHDEGQFHAADQFLPDRQQNRHLAFGQGIHFCVGASLARLEMRIVTEEILRRLPDFQLCAPVQREFSVGQVYGPPTLPVVFTPGQVE
ncbi:cytochrome P450 [Tengunoibacter tsumagoiensis]|uniref:Cytochrome P450 n=1 Tax=Tengunoibacter tsumagoiensis TaxID=2014871 RepID=A0A402A966_9CHLR|nr:cytochrome P450 [Tengunoibacter tsumagoiensis]GCE15717.1 cytochrome P450 [Tengunoibacter tsumagoiensis]